MALHEEDQRGAKLEQVLVALERTGGVSRDRLEVSPMEVPPQALGYRRRAVLHWGPDGLGYFGRRSHTHVPVEVCPALTDPLANLPGKLSPLLEGIQKDLESVELLAEGPRVSIALRLKGKVRPKHREAASQMLSTLKLAGAVLLPKEGTPELLGEPTLATQAPGAQGVTLYGRPDAFTQANATGAALLVASAMRLLEPAEDEHVLELFSGNGLFTFALAARAASVLGVEGAKVSSQLAQKAATEAGVKNVRFIQGDVFKVVEGLRREGQTFDVLFLDPPRTGAPGVGRWASEVGAERVLYVACDVFALARDVKGLTEAGFQPRRLQITDMFPQTHHIECCLLLTR
jgi:23S rRNA (uracil1939-C5)-methyltransferase